LGALWLSIITNCVLEISFHIFWVTKPFLLLRMASAQQAFILLRRDKRDFGFHKYTRRKVFMFKGFTRFELTICSTTFSCCLHLTVLLALNLRLVWCSQDWFRQHENVRKKLPVIWNLMGTFAKCLSHMIKTYILLEKMSH